MSKVGVKTAYSPEGNYALLPDLIKWVNQVKIDVYESGVGGDYLAGAQEALDGIKRGLEHIS